MPQLKPERYGSIPKVLRDIPRWLLYKIEIKDNGKPTKVPYKVDGRGKASSSFPQTWTNFDAAVQAVEQGKADGIGFVFDGSDGITGIDLDHHYVDGKPDDLAADILSMTQGYVEVSPSGDGLHIITRTPYKKNLNTSKTHPGVEMYAVGRFFTFTGNEEIMYSTDIPDVAVSQDSLISKYYGPAAVSQANYVPPENAFELYKERSFTPIEDVKAILDRCDPNTDYFTWIKVGQILHFEGAGAYEYLALWDEWSASATRTDKHGNSVYSPSACDAKWDTFDDERYKTGKPVAAIGTLVDIAKAAAPFDPVKALDGWYNAAELAGKVQPPKYVIDGLLEAEAKLLIWGKTTARKSFFAIDMAVCVASGTPFFGRRIKQSGPVVFIAGEGAGGLARRFEACCRKYGLDLKSLPIYFNRDNKDLMAPVIVKDLNNLGDQIKKDHGRYPLMYFFDTYNTSSSADENKAEDFATTLGHLREITNYQGAVPAIIHHPGKDGKTYRGSSAMGAGMDTEIFMDRQDGSDITTVSNPKQKEGEAFLPFTIESEEVILGQNDEGEFYGSLVLKLSDEPPSNEAKRKDGAKMGKWQVEIKTQLNEEPRTLEELIACVPLDFDGYRLRTSEIKRAVKQMLKYKEIWVDDDGKYALENEA